MIVSVTTATKAPIGVHKILRTSTYNTPNKLIDFCLANTSNLQSLSHGPVSKAVLLNWYIAKAILFSRCWQATELPDHRPTFDLFSFQARNCLVLKFPFKAPRFSEASSLALCWYFRSVFHILVSYAVLDLRSQSVFLAFMSFVLSVCSLYSK